MPCKKAEKQCACKFFCKNRKAFNIWLTVERINLVIQGKSCYICLTEEIENWLEYFFNCCIDMKAAFIGFIFGCFVIYAQSQNLLNLQMPEKGFERNSSGVFDQLGHLNKEAVFVYSGLKFDVILRNSGFSFQFFSQMDENNNFNYYRLDYSFKNTSNRLEILVGDSKPNYKTNRIQSKYGATVTESYHQIVYHNIYENIDLVFEATESKEYPIKYYYVLHPGADVNDIEILIEGFNSIDVQQDCISFKMQDGLFKDSLPGTYTSDASDDASKREYFPCVYTKKNGNSIGFQFLHSVVSGKTVYIDPLPASFSTSSFGGSGFESGQDIIATDSSYYIVGYTNSISGIATSGAHQGVLAGNFDAFLYRADYTNNIIFATYFGGSGNDMGEGISIGDNHSVFITGTTASNSVFGTAGTHKDTLSGVSDAFIAKFDANGNLTWSTYMGGDATETGAEIGYRSNVGLFVCGSTKSSSGVAFGSTSQPVFSGIEDGFIASFDTLTGQLLWSGYCGGPESDRLNGLSVNNAFVIVGGETSSTSGISTGGSHQSAHGGMLDGFVAKYNLSGIKQWASYYGGSSDDGVEDVVFDFSGNVYITGFTKSSNGISTSVSYQPSFGGGIDAFLVKFNSLGVRSYGTYVGGAGDDLGNGVCVSNTKTFIAGYTTSATGIASNSAADQTFDGGSDAFWACFHQVTGANLWSTYVGGGANDFGTSTSFDTETSRFFMTGYFEAVILPNSSSSPGGTYYIDSLGFIGFSGIGNSGGSSSAGTAQGTDSDCTFSITTGSNSPVCAGTQLNVFASSSSAATYYWSGPGGFASNAASNSMMAGMQYNGPFSVFAVDANGCMASSTVNVVVMTRPIISLTGCSMSPVCAGVLSFTAGGANTYNWNGLPSGTIVFPNSSMINPAYCQSGGFSVVGVSAMGCFSDPISCLVNVIPIPFPSSVTVNGATQTVGTTKSLCVGQSLNVSITMPSYSYGPITYQWTGPNGFIANTSGFSIPAVTASNQGQYKLHMYFSNYGNCNPTGGSIGSCYLGDYRFNLNVNTGPAISVSSNAPVCMDDTLRIFSSGAVSYQWNGPDGFVSSNQSPTIPNVALANSGNYSLTATGSNSCTSVTNIYAEVLPAPIIDVNVETPICTGDSCQLIFSGADYYEWFGPDSVIQYNDTTFFMASLSDNGYYSIEGTGNNGCKNDTSFYLQVHQPAIIGFSLPELVCINDSLTFQAINALSCDWLYPDGSSHQGVYQSISPILPEDSGIYYLSATDSNGCIIKLLDTLSLFPLSIMNVCPDINICQSDTAHFWASGLNSYIWNGPLMNNVSFQDTLFHVSNANWDGLYFVNGRDSNNCRYSDTVHLHVFDHPSIQINSNDPVCVGDSLIIQATGGGAYHWTGPQNLQNFSPLLIIPVTSLSDSGSYVIVVVDTNGCYADSVINPVIIEIPMISATSNSPVCLGDSLVLSAFGGDHFYWTTPDGQVIEQQVLIIPTASFADSGFYHVFSSEQNSCFSDTISINTFIEQSIVTAASNSPICVGDRLILMSEGYDSICWFTPNNQIFVGDTLLLSGLIPADSGFYCAFSAGALCPDTSCTWVQIFEYPVNCSIQGNSTTTYGQCYWYSVSCSFSSINWNAVNGSILQGQGTDSVFVCWNNNASGLIQAMIFNGPCSHTDSMNISVETGLENYAESNLFIYPNPASDFINISFDSEIFSVCIRDQAGRSILISQPNKRMVSIDVNQLSPGFYLIEIEYKNGTKFSGFIRE